MRKIPFVENEFYHIYNRGVDKRSVFSDKNDLDRFFQSMVEFNTVEPIGSIYEKSLEKESDISPPLVEFVAYCLNPNHFHFILTQVQERGIEKFMHRLGTGYTRYFNERHSRSGSLFQGRFKANHINSNEYLLHASVYVNLNYKAHKLNPQKHLFVSSWNEYLDLNQSGICKKETIREQFKNAKEYRRFAESTLKSILDRKELLAELENERLEAQPPSI